jgi:hypothetical protein
MKTRLKRAIMVAYDRGFLSFAVTGFMIRSLGLAES